MDSLLTPVIHAGLGTTAAISVTQTPAQLQTADPLTVPAGGFDAMLTAAGNLNVSLTNTAASMVKSLFAAQGDPANALTQDLNAVEKSIQNIQATLVDMFKEMERGFEDIDFENHQILAGLSDVEFQLGQLEYQTDLTDADVVALGQGQIQTQIQGTINQCLDLAARQLEPLDFAGFTSRASQFKTEALTSANNDVVEFTTAPPPAPTWRTCCAC